MTFRVRLGRRCEVGSDLAHFVNALRDYFVEELQGAELGDLWSRPPPSTAPRPFAYPMRCPELADVAEEPMALVDDDGEPVAPKWQPARSHSATQW